MTDEFFKGIPKTNFNVQFLDYFLFCFFSYSSYSNKQNPPLWALPIPNSVLLEDIIIYYKNLKRSENEGTCKNNSCYSIYVRDLYLCSPRQIPDIRTKKARGVQYSNILPNAKAAHFVI
jgi:hypothetical protein